MCMHVLINYDRREMGSEGCEYLGHLHFSIRVSFGGGRGAWDIPRLIMFFSINFISSLLEPPEAISSWGHDPPPPPPATCRGRESTCNSFPTPSKNSCVKACS